MGLFDKIFNRGAEKLLTPEESAKKAQAKREAFKEAQVENEIAAKNVQELIDAATKTAD